MDKASAASSPEPNKTEKMLLIAKNYWNYTTQPIVFVAPTLQMAADIRNRFFRLIESCNTVLGNPRRVRCLSLCEPDGLKSLMGRSLLNTRNAAFFFDHTCFDRSDLLVATGKLVNAIRENRLGEIIKDDSFTGLTFRISNPTTVGALERATRGGLVDLPRRPWTTETEGGATVPCPWGREDGRETFYPADYLPMNDPSKQAADAVARQARRQAEIDADALRQAIQDMVKEKESQKPSVDLKPRHEVDKLRTADILQAMIMCNAADKAIPEEWMDELSDLVWRERDRLGANTED